MDKFRFNKIALFSTKYSPFGGTFASVKMLKEVLAINNIDCDLYCIGKPKPNNLDIIFISSISKDLFYILDNYDIVHCFKLWDKDIHNNILNSLIKLAQKKKLIISLHDPKDLLATSKRNINNLLYQLLQYPTNLMVHGKEEYNFYSNNLALYIPKIYYVPHLYLRKNIQEMHQNKNKIVITSRIDFCKGLEYIKKYIDSGLSKYPIEFWSGYINEAFVYFTKFDNILRNSMYKGKFEGTKEDYDKIYSDARILLNFTYWGKGSGGRTEITILEAWDYGVTPFLDKRWVETPNSIFKHSVNCIAIDRTKKDFRELNYYIDKIFNDNEYFSSLQKEGEYILKSIIKNNNLIIKTYERIYDESRI